MSTPRQHPRRRRSDRPNMFVLGGQAPTPSQVQDFLSDPPPAELETGNLPAWGLQVEPDAKPADVADAVLAAMEWDRAASVEPYQIDVTREMDDTVRMGNSLSAAVRLELLADSMREEFRDRRRDPVDGAELDPVDGLPLPAEEDQELAPQLEQWETLADLEASARPLLYAAPPPSRVNGDAVAADQLEDVEPVGMSRAQAQGFDGAPVRVMAWASRHDPASLEFGVRARLRAPAPLVDRVWPQPPILDQGTAPPLSLHDASGCTGHAGVNAANVRTLAAGAVEPDELLDGADAMRLYDLAQDRDAWPGDEYPGTSILAVMKAGQDAGLWGTYLWAFGTKDVAQALLQVGPVVIGIPWLSQMAEPGPDGIVTVGGQSLGGHALCLFAIRMKVAGKAGPWFGALQTYGPEVGDGGVIWIHHKDLARLLRSRGEAAIPLMEMEAAR